MADYPSEATLQKIRDWDINDCQGVLEFIMGHWKWMGREARPGLYTFGTAGWSGNEDLLGALYESMPWHILHLTSIKLPGGLLCVAISDSAKEDMRKLHDQIVTWAWSREAS